MFVDFFLTLKKAGLPVSITEYLALLSALKHGLGAGGLDAAMKTLNG
ncbi:hypothetical protein [Crenobacter cavernae]|nr:hypothetical protein [Crenobacter cavernae]